MAAPASSFRAPEVTTSLDLGFELTNLCNLHCTHCIRGSHQPELDHLDLDLFERVVDESRTLFDHVEVVFTGGEPLASELFAMAVAKLAERGIDYRFVTNGWLVPRQLPTLLAHQPRLVRVSLSGAHPATHDAQRGRGSFRRALVAAAVLLTRDIRVDFGFLVNRRSRAEIGEAIALAEQLGMATLHVTLAQPTPETVLDGTDLAPDEWRDVTRDVRALAASSRVRVTLDYGVEMPLAERHPCHAMSLRQLYVDARGRASFCCQLSRYGSGDDPVHGDLRTEALAAIVDRAATTYAEFQSETLRLHTIGRWDALDDFPCLSCARRHGKTGFLAAASDHPWAALARRS